MDERTHEDRERAFKITLEALKQELLFPKYSEANIEERAEMVNKFYNLLFQPEKQPEAPVDEAFLPWISMAKAQYEAWREHGGGSLMWGAKWD